MTNKWGKYLLSITAAVVIGGAVCLLKNKMDENSDKFDDECEDEDFDLDNVSDRGYVSLTPNAADETPSESEDTAAVPSKTSETANA